MAELDINKKYPVSEIRQLTTKYGAKIIVELEDASVISLPQRCANRASDYLKLNDIIPLYFVYLGSKDTASEVLNACRRPQLFLKTMTYFRFMNRVVFPSENHDVDPSNQTIAIDGDTLWT
ncbi:hypothetical protein AVEN_218022-1 [Araneus ventricosus]|uniref:Uncharacterized protein n=1 Tax=Araneus ventricosus TaxID=182803 RepID=A0A4Y2W046_ARAVE|nr:hypothetical protein AVEN_218022-1 [Araneus ventricosus]